MLPSDLKKSHADKQTRRRNMAHMRAKGLPPRNDIMPQCLPETRAIADLSPPTRTLRKNQKHQIDRLCELIRTMGFRVPILIDPAGNIIDGVSRWHAAKRLGIKHMHCVVVYDATAEELRLLRLAANKLPQEAEWSIEELKVEFEELISLGAPIEVAGFSEIEVDQIMLEDEVDGIETGPIEPSPEQPAIAQLGDIFQLGDHLIGCGNATDEQFVSLLLSGKDLQLALHDPPYNLPASEISTTHTRDFLQGSGEMSSDEFLVFVQKWLWLSRNFMADGALAAVFCDWRTSHQITRAALHNEFAHLNTIVWGKTAPGLGSFYRSQHEFLQLYRNGSKPHINNIRLGKNGRSRSNLWTHPGASSIGSDARKGLKDHPTVKPVAMLKEFIIDVTHQSDWIFDAFLGSGSTLMAAEQTGRRCVGLDLDPRYIDVVIRRWETETGGKAIKKVSEPAPIVVPATPPQAPGNWS
ncbi:DNA modification methylase [Methylocella sp. CPCC 101449]|uniref:DNA modification methylase n=1 Tax=Methylocella sp. CPCC 101449 TaxID=2987531 RepID=UPI00288D7CFE|nr:DNA modification methylase [Methylocella sp. CPCC 101449]MDT2019477.1 DNA modification methylase [Methylocella sp. CPCC 101449]